LTLKLTKRIEYQNLKQSLHLSEEKIILNRRRKRQSSKQKIQKQHNKHTQNVMATSSIVIAQQQKVEYLLIIKPQKIVKTSKKNALKDLQLNNNQVNELYNNQSYDILSNDNVEDDLPETIDIPRSIEPIYAIAKAVNLILIKKERRFYNMSNNLERAMVEERIENWEINWNIRQVIGMSYQENQGRRTFRAKHSIRDLIFIYVMNCGLRGIKFIGPLAIRGTSNRQEIIRFDTQTFDFYDYGISIEDAFDYSYTFGFDND